jgi:hypothetical protein
MPVAQPSFQAESREVRACQNLRPSTVSLRVSPALNRCSNLTVAIVSLGVTERNSAKSDQNGQICTPRVNRVSRQASPAQALFGAPGIPPWAPPAVCAARQLGQEGPNQNPLLVGEVTGMRRSRKGHPGQNGPCMLIVVRVQLTHRNLGIGETVFGRRLRV